MTLEQVYLYVLVCECGSISLASKRAFLSRQAVSQSIISLEEELGTRLLERDNSGIRLTSQGSFVYEQCKIILEAKDRIEVNTTLHSASQTEALSIGLSLGVLAAIGISRFKKLQEDFPSIRITLHDDTDLAVEAKLLQDEYDIGFVIEPVNRSDFVVLPLYKEENYLRVYKGHALFENERVSIEDLTDQKFVCPGPEQKFHYGFRAWCEEIGIHPDILETQLCTEFSSMELLAMQENALFMAPSHIAKIEAPYVKSFELPVPMYWSVALAVKRDKAITSGMRKFIDYIKSSMNLSQ